jgi:hypothetical protein
MTTPAPRGNQLSDADYERATTERARHARARGLAAPYIPGGEDPEAEATARRERALMRLLIVMVVAIITGGFAISIVGLIITGGR